MGIFDGVLFLSDCDGTMTNSRQELSENNARAIRFFMEEGGLFSFASGRFPKHADRFRDQIRPNAPLIMGNGTSICAPDSKELLHETILEEPLPFDALQMIVDTGLCVAIWLDYRTYSDGWMKMGVESPFGNQREVVRDLEALYAKSCSSKGRLLEGHEPWHKINFVFATPEDTQKVQRLAQKAFPDYGFVRSWPVGMELLPAGGGKGNALKLLKTQLPQIRLTVAAGDFENDVSLLQEADIGYAVKNADASALAAASRITEDLDHDPIACIVNELAKELSQ